MDINLLYLAKTWHHFGISDQNLNSPAQYPKYLRTKFKNIQPLLPKIKNKNKNKIGLKFSKVENTSSLIHCQMFLYKKSVVTFLEIVTVQVMVTIQGLYPGEDRLGLGR